MPRLAEIFPEFSGLNDRIQGFTNLMKGFRGEIQEHKDNLNENMDEPKDFVEAFLMEGKKSPAEFGDDKQLEYCLLDLFLAGAETTSSNPKMGNSSHGPESRSAKQMQRRNHVENRNG